MRKRLLVMLLCTTLTATVLSGCGNKETVAEPVESTSIEEIVVEESSEPVSVEETTTSEPIEEPVPEPTTEVNKKLDIVVEVSPEVQQAKDEKMPIGVESTMDFGTIMRLGDNEDYPNALENLEIHFMDKVFRVTLPKDMCVSFKADKDAQQLDVYNQDESKRLWVFFTGTTTTEENKKPMNLETAKNVTAFYGLSVLDNADVVIMEDTKDLIVVHVPACIENAQSGEFISYKTYTDETTEWEGEDGTTNVGYLGTAYYIFYGDKDVSVNPELASYIAESFKVVE